MLVPGDVIHLNGGDTVPADARLLALEGDVLIIDEVSRHSSQVVIKRAGDAVYSGSICEQGASTAVIIATGVPTSTSTSFSNQLIAHNTHQQHLQKVLGGIWNVCIWLAAVGALVEIIVMYPFQHCAFRAGIDNLLVIVIAAIPVALHTNALYITYSGSQILCLKGAILKRLTVIKEIADMDIILCTDTAGALTLNKLTIDKTLGINVKMITETMLEVVEQFQARKLIVCGIGGHGVSDVPVLKKADIGIAVANATDAARRASTIVLTKPDLNVIVKVVKICRKISRSIKDYCIHTISITVYTVLGFMLLAFIWKIDLPPVMILQIVIFNEVFLIGTYGGYRVKCSSTVPDRWGLPEILKPGVAIGLYLAFSTVFFLLDSIGDRLLPEGIWSSEHHGNN